MGLSIELAAEMVVMAGLAPSLEDARAACLRTIADGSALETFGRLIAAQGGDPRVIDRPSLLPTARREHILTSPESGFVRSLAARPLGHATMLLGAGRSRMDSSVDHAVGVILHKKVGARVGRDEPLCTLLVNDEARLAEAETLIRDAYRLGEEPVAARPLIEERIAPGPLSFIRGPSYADGKVGGRHGNRGPTTDDGRRTTDQRTMDGTE
jgi:thymidine phosphorylase